MKMNKETRALLKILSLLNLIICPFMIVFFFFIFLRDMSLREVLTDKSFIKVEIFLITAFLLALWNVKRNGWDFWNKIK